MGTLKELHILIGEDNEDDVFIMREAFRKAGAKHVFHVVCDGAEIVNYLKGEAAYGDRKQHPFPDILLLDLNMPRMNGFEVLEWLRHDDRCGRLMVHVLTASSRESDVERAYKMGANGYILKPARLDELVALASAIEQWHRFLCLPPGPGVEKPVARVRSQVWSPSQQAI
jgi:CheY-like chemotaxis protein